MKLIKKFLFKQAERRLKNSKLIDSHGAIVAAGVVVTRDDEPYSLVAGSLARHIKWRFDEPTRFALLEMEWWNWTPDEIVKLAPLLSNNKTEELNCAAN